MRGYPDKLRILSAFGPTKESQVDTHKPTVMVWVKRKTLGLFRLHDSFSSLYRYTESIQNFRFSGKPFNLGIHLVTATALKILNFSGYPLTWVSISLQQKHSKFSLFCSACMLSNFDTVTSDIMTSLNLSYKFIKIFIFFQRILLH